MFGIDDLCARERVGQAREESTHKEEIIRSCLPLVLEIVECRKESVCKGLRCLNF